MRALVLLLAACNGPSISTDRPHDAGTSIDAQPAIPPLGWVDVSTTKTGDKMGFGRVDAIFGRGFSYGVEPGPGACVLSRSAPVDQGHALAGTITVSGTNPTVTMMENTDGTYTTYSASGLLFGGGETIEIAAAGGTVAPFDATLVAPYHPTMTTPLPSTLARNADQQLTWTAGISAGADVEITIAPASDLSLAVICRFAVDDGSGIVPGSLLGQLPVGSAYLGAQARAESTIGDGTRRILLYVDANSINASGTSWGGMTELQ